MKVIKPTIVASLLLGLLVPAFGLWAQSSSPQARVAFSIAPFQTLSIGGGQGNRSVSSTVQVPQPRPADLARGYIELPDAVELSLRSNVPWVVKVRTDNLTMGRSLDGTFTKPISDFQLRVGASPYLTVKNQDQVLTQGPFGRYHFQVDYRVRFDPQTHRDGAYRLNVIYTISSR